MRITNESAGFKRAVHSKGMTVAEIIGQNHKLYQMSTSALIEEENKRKIAKLERRIERERREREREEERERTIVPLRQAVVDAEKKYNKVKNLKNVDKLKVQRELLLARYNLNKAEGFVR